MKELMDIAEFSAAIIILVNFAFVPLLDKLKDWQLIPDYSYKPFSCAFCLTFWGGIIHFSIEHGIEHGIYSACLSAVLTALLDRRL